MRFIIQFFDEHTLVLFALLILVAIFFWVMKFQKKLKLSWKEALLVALAHVVIGWSCMRLMAILEVGGNLEEAASMRLYGAFFVLPFLYYAWAKLTRRNVKLVMDIAAICTIFGAISGRLNCLTSGCCKGIEAFGPDSWRWPIREAELVYYGIFLVIFCRKIRKAKTHGEVYPIFLISYGALRFICECLREEFTTQVGLLHLAHMWSIISIVAGVIWYCLLRKKSINGRKSIDRYKKTRREPPK